MSEYTLYNGDCLEVMQALEAGSVDLVLTDPPYGTTQCKWDTIIPFEPMWESIKHVAKPRAAIALFGSQPFTSALVMSKVEWFKYEWVWDKKLASNFLNANRTPLMVHENIAVFGLASANYYPQMGEGDPYKKTGYRTKLTPVYGGFIPVDGKSDGDRYPVSIISKSNASRNNRLHPTQKPVALMEYLIKTYTNEGDTVLDFTMGSGTTGVACARTGRNFIGIELDKGYFEIAQERIRHAYAETPLPKKLDNGKTQLSLFGGED